MDHIDFAESDKICEIFGSPNLGSDGLFMKLIKKSSENQSIHSISNNNPGSSPKTDISSSNSDKSSNKDNASSNQNVYSQIEIIVNDESELNKSKVRRASVSSNSNEDSDNDDHTNPSNTKPSHSLPISSAMPTDWNTSAAHHRGSIVSFAQMHNL